MEMKLEVATVPVSDVDRAKAFYEGLGWRMDVDYANGDDFRVVRLTPPGSHTSIVIGKGVTTAVPGSVDGLALVVEDIRAARDELVGRGAEVSEIFHDPSGVFRHAGTAARLAGPAPDHATYTSFASFCDPDGNGWIVQELAATP
jgi:catechol 2,3-dioxygenase-like lactoylglutathione lyase family enzyme